jgi:hypothetical protein
VTRAPGPRIGTQGKGEEGTSLFPSMCGRLGLSESVPGPDTSCHHDAGPGTASATRWQCHPGPAGKLPLAPLSGRLELPAGDEQASGRAAVTSGARGVTVAAPAGARPGGSFECAWCPSN